MKILQWFKSDCIDFTKPDKPVEVKKEPITVDGFIKENDPIVVGEGVYIEPVEYAEIKYNTPFKIPTMYGNYVHTGGAYLTLG